jgi:AcrR family transcriptional regulator
MTTQVFRKPAESRRRRQREEVRHEILEATGALLVSEGYDGFSMRRLVERCGYTAPTIYHHFGDKAGLIDALLERRFREMVEHIDRVPKNCDAAETLRAQLAAFVDFGLENPAHYGVLMAPRPADLPPPQTTEQSRDRIEETLSMLASEGRLRVDDIEEAVQCIWVSLHGLISARITHTDYAWTPSHVAVSIDVLLRGLLKEIEARSEVAEAATPDRSPQGGSS